MTIVIARPETTRPNCTEQLPGAGGGLQLQPVVY